MVAQDYYCADAPAPDRLKRQKRDFTGDEHDSKARAYCQCDIFISPQILPTASNQLMMCDVQQYGQGIRVT